MGNIHPACMKINILTIGSRGDIQPYVALGMGLKKAGHTVQISTHERFRDFVVSRGLEFFPVTGDPLKMLETDAGREWLETEKNPFAMLKRLKDLAEPEMFNIMDSLLRSCRNNPDLIAFHPLVALASNSIAEKLGIPAVPAYLTHVHPTREFPPPIASPLPFFGRILNPVFYQLVGKFYWHLMGPATNKWRREALNLPNIPRGGPFNKWLRQKRPCIYGFSRHVIPRPPEWGKEISITGYWFLDTEKSWQPPADLAAFIESGPAPVFVGFGSMVSRKPEETTEIVVKAIEKSGQRCVLASGWSGLGMVKLPDSIFRIDGAPFDWLFPQMAAVVHHGGAGTTAEGLRSGVPAVIVPFFADQFFWAWRVRELGAGPQGIPHKKLTAGNLSDAIIDAIKNTNYKDNAMRMSRLLRTEDGVGNAVRRFSDLVIW